MNRGKKKIAKSLSCWFSMVLWKWNHCNTSHFYHPLTGCCTSWLQAVYSSDFTHHKNVTAVVLCVALNMLISKKKGRRILYSNKTAVNMYKNKLKFPKLEFIWVTKNWHSGIMGSVMITNGQDLVMYLIYNCSRIVMLTSHWRIGSSLTCSVFLSVQVFLRATLKYQSNIALFREAGSQHIVVWF